MTQFHRNQPPPTTQEEDQSCEASGSIIECQNQTLGERLPVVGTPFTLNYRSNRTPGFNVSKSFDIPLTGGTLPGSLMGIVLEISIAGRSFSQNFLPSPNQIASFDWDGLDVYGRPLQGSQRVNVGIGYIYRPQYYPVIADFEQSFSRPFPGAQVVASRDTSSIIIRQDVQVTINPWDASGQGLGGWNLNVHHAYDPIGQILYLGNGERRSAFNQAWVIDTVAGTGMDCSDYSGPCGDGGPATQATLEPWGVIAAPDGSLIVTDNNSNRIRRVGPDGLINSIAGNEWCQVPTDPCGDGGPATQASFSEIFLSALGPDGSIYIADKGDNRIRRVSPDGIITTVAGTGVAGFSGDGGPATLARINNPQGVTVGPDGSLYIMDSWNYRIRRVGPDGIITTLVGNGSPCSPQQFNPCGDDGPATQALLHNVLDLVVGKDGTVYFGSNNRVRKVSPDGIITTVAGNGQWAFGGDGGPATEALLGPIGGLAFARDGSLLVADIGNHRIRQISSDGIINTIAGSGAVGASAGFAGDNGFATAAKLHSPWGIAAGPNGDIYIADDQNRRVRRLRPFLPGFTDADIVISSSGGKELYLFDHTGRHLRTVSVLTGAIIYEFTYDTQGKLIQVRDDSNNTTILERDTSGNPTAIVGPYGQRTTLALDANGYLARITNPAGETTTFQYTERWPDDRDDYAEGPRLQLTPMTPWAG